VSLSHLFPTAVAGALTLWLSGVQCVWPAYRVCRTKPQWHFIWQLLLWGSSHAAELSSRFQCDEKGEESQTNTGLAQSPIAKQCRWAQRDVHLDGRRPRWNREWALTFFFADETWFFSVPRLEGRSAKWNEKGITSPLWTWRPLLETRPPEGKYCYSLQDMLLLYSTNPLCSKQHHMIYFLYCRNIMETLHTVFKSMSSIFHVSLFSGWENWHVSSTKDSLKSSQPPTLATLKGIYSCTGSMYKPVV